MTNLPSLDEIKKDDVYIWVKINYGDPLLFPLKQGFEYITGLSKSLQLKTQYIEDNKTTSIVRNEQDIRIGFMSAEAIQEIIVGQELLGIGEPNGN